MFLFFVLCRLMLSGIFYGLEIQHGIFMVIFWGFVGTPRGFLGFDFRPQSIIPFT